MVDTLAQEFDFSSAELFTRNVCKTTQSDGVLFLVRHDTSHLAMSMYNTDGSQAEMCGNGMRCIARLASERYIAEREYTLYSAARPYPITCQDNLAEYIPSFGVDIAIRTSSPDFTLSCDKFIDSPISEIDAELRFSYLNLGNPHIVTLVEDVDLERLTAIAQRTIERKDIFPNGVNVSMIQRKSESEIFVATFERGVGLTASCGTAMTASATAVALMGLSPWGESINVYNRGGMVRCIPSLTDDKISTQLIGNATYISKGEVSPTGEIISGEAIAHEQQAWLRFTTEIAK